MTERERQLLAEYRAHIWPETFVVGRCFGGRVLHVWLGWHNHPAICGSRVGWNHWATEWSAGTFCPKCLRTMERAIRGAGALSGGGR